MKKILLTASALLLLTGCNGAKKEENEKEDSKELKKVTLMLDWTPNTNHTGIYVAQEKGYFKDRGLDVTIKTPGEVNADQLVAVNKVQFGISAQEQVTQARTEGIPVKSIGAIIQHNTSGFMSLKDKNITSPKDYVNKTYGGWGAPVEEPMIQAVMKKDGADAKDVKIVNIGDTDFFNASKKNIDFSWVYYGWTGIEAETRGVPVNMQYLIDYDTNLDYYTPVIISNEKYLAENGEVAKEFMGAVREGYEFSIKHDEESAEILMKQVPELKEQKELVLKSQSYLKDKYTDDAPYFGYQDEKIWNNYATFLKENKVITSDFNAKEAFSNEYVEGK